MPAETPIETQAPCILLPSFETLMDHKSHRGTWIKNTLATNESETNGRPNISLQTPIGEEKIGTL